MKKYCFGIDVGGTTIKCGLFDVEGNVLEKWEIVTRTENNGAFILQDIAETINHKIQEKALDREEIAGVGLGIPGPVNDNGQVSRAVNLHWGYVDVSGDLGKMTGLTVKAGNDANVAALGELWRGGGAGHHNMILVTLGTGVGGGIIINDKIVAGSHGAGGEIGHSYVGDLGLGPCNCGNHGCLELVASATGIAHLARLAVEKSDMPSILRGKTLSAKTVFDAVKQQDALAISIAEQFGRYLGIALSQFAAVCDPEIIVIGGGVSKAGPVVLDYIMGPYKEHAFPDCKETKFALATLGNDAGIYGAAKMVL